MPSSIGSSISPQAISAKHFHQLQDNVEAERENVKTWQLYQEQAQEKEQAQEQEQEQEQIVNF